MILSHRFKENVAKYSSYSWKRKPFNLTAVYIADGRFYAGGLTDRFKGMVSLYAWAKKEGLPFRIEHTEPFQLAQYLVPNEYDWLSREGDYVKSVWTADVIYATAEANAVRRLYGKGRKRQVHFYGNKDLLDSMGVKSDEWGEIFKALFKPSVALQSSIDAVRPKLGGRWFSAVFRFQNLLGDFPEYDFQPLKTEDEKEKLINACLSEIEELVRKENGMSCLVASDSISFLERAASLDCVKTIPGRIVHPGTHACGDYEIYEKSFVDFYLLSESTKIYSIVYDRMYPSKFPMYAAKLNNIPFIRKFDSVL